MTATDTVERELDARGLHCPLPLLKAKQALNALPEGACLRVLATDPGSVRDFHSWMEHSGHQLVSFHETTEQFVYVVKKSVVKKSVVKKGTT